MARHIVDINLDNLSDLPDTCRSCVFWEMGPAAPPAADVLIEKEAWISDTLLEWGPCGKIAYADGVAAGYVLYAPAPYVPRAASFPTAPVSPDAVLFMSGRVLSDFGGQGVGRSLAQEMSRDIAERGIKAVEAFGRTGLPHLSGVGCVLPVGYLRAVGFKTVREHPHTPRLRLESKVPTAWRAEIEAAVDRLIGSATATVM